MEFYKIKKKKVIFGKMSNFKKILEFRKFSEALGVSAVFRKE
jgi:hypothetical protein